MRTFFRLFIITVILAVSCTKPEVNYDGTTWTGGDDSLGLDLIFQEGSRVCHLWAYDKSLLGDEEALWDSMIQIDYDVKWYSRNSFSLTLSDAGQTIVYYTGEIYGEKMLLYVISCDKVEKCLVLQQYKFQYLNDLYYRLMNSQAM